MPIASADRALRALSHGPTRGLRVLLQTSAAAYLGTAANQGEAADGGAATGHDGRAEPVPGRGAPLHLVLVNSGGTVVPDSLLLPAGLTWRQLLAPHVSAGAAIVIGDGALDCAGHTVAVRPDLDLTVPTVPRHLAAAGLRQIEAALRGAHTSPAAAPWPALHHRWSSGLADPETMVDDAPRLIGRGPGVTPSGDDILAAAILGHTVLGTPGIGAAAARIADLSAGRTTAAALVSTKGAADGRAAEPLRRALRTLAQGREAAGPLHQVLRLGHTSGADLLRGLRDAFAAVARTTGAPSIHVASTPAASTPAVAERKVS